MSGVAFTIRSPSSSRISRNVVCVAGCWGPKLRVQVNCLESAPTSGSSSKFDGMMMITCVVAGTSRCGAQARIDCFGFTHTAKEEVEKEQNKKKRTKTC